MTEIKITCSLGVRTFVCLIMLNIILTNAYMLYKLWEVLFC